ncbi:hypothetical protein IGS68_23195 [Skermanella sp. TT6]|uniref:Uncharacterized protein n=1 Tax=Skermanella cutis TaxID=2775420 RepID=A0ABX7B3H4_9PROT|nr:hypothetical protein [Skermanella sp. TT6]QQP88886.1 hypothetical protein IGS68_23195 [Skermanella sp. TT6]
MFMPTWALHPGPTSTRPNCSCSIELALENAGYLGLSPSGANAIVREVASATSRWRTVAASLGVKPSEIDRMETAFEHGELRLALNAGNIHPVPGAPPS